MSLRRRLLLAMLNAFKWIAHSFTNLYYSLIPTTISGKKVQDKAKVVKVYGNSEVKNQYAQTYSTSTYVDVTTTASNNGRKITFSGNASGWYLLNNLFNKTIPSGHKVLVSAKITNSSSISNSNLGFRLRTSGAVANTISFSNFNGAQIETLNGDIDMIQMYGINSGDYTGLTIEDVQVIDLTQRFPFDTPTTLTDARVQKILNGGYEEYNLGEIVDVDMGEIDSEPYNLFDGEWDKSVNDTIFDFSNYIEVVGGLEYTAETTDMDYQAMYFFAYDENYNQLDNIPLTYLTSKSRKGTIPYNCKYVKVRIYNSSGITQGEFAFRVTDTRTGYAPIKTFNLFDEETILALLQYDKNASNFGQQISGSNITSKNYISVLPNKEYSVSGATSQANMILFCYDESKNAIIVGNNGYIAITSNGQTFTTPSDCRYVRFYMSNPYGTTYNHDICINVSGNKNGTYMPYGVVDNLSLFYQGAGVGTAHDTMEQTDTEYVFTKANDEYAFTGNETWNFYGSGESPFFYMQYPSEMSNAKQGGNTHPLLTNGIVATMNSSNFRVHLSVNPQLTSSSNMSDYFTNKTVCKFELATPQVIRIPRKHLGVVRVKDLTWEYLSSTFGGSFKASVSGLKSSSAYYSIDNTYSSKFETVSRGQLSSYSFAMASQPSILFVRSVDCLNVSDFLAKYGNTLIFYETQDEVADIDLTILVEAGGTLTSNWFSWVRNQLLSHGNFDATNGWNTNSGINLTVANNVGTLAISGTNASANLNRAFSIINGHSYLFRVKAKSSETTTLTRISFYDTSYTSQIAYRDFGSLTANTKYDLIGIITSNRTDSNAHVIFYPSLTTALSVGSSVELQDFEVIDLTVGFGAGKEPTDINDPVIKEIIRLGYIPTDVSGTITNVDSKVLPDIDCKIKCK